MNILFVCEYEWFKSVVFDIHVLAEGLSLRGHNVHVIDYEWDDRSQIRFKTSEVDNAARVYSEARVYLHRPGFIRLRLKRPGFAKCLPLEYFSTVITHHREIARVIREKDIDVIVLYSVLVNGLPAISLARQHNIPVVLRNIDMLHRVSSSSLKCKAIKFFEKRVYPRVDAFLALTPKYREYLISLGADGSRVELLLFPIDPEVFHPGADPGDIRQKWGIDAGDQVITFIGGLYRFGALNDFIRSFHEVIKEAPRARLLIVGDGLARPELEKTVMELGLSGKVIIAGNQPFQDMPKYVNLAALCINAFPTTGFTRDLFSAKIVQYLACGKATVSSALPGISTLIPEKKCGVIYADSIGDMVREVVKLLKSPEQRAKLGEAGLKYVRKAHHQDIIIGQFEEALERAIAGKRRRKKK